MADLNGVISQGENETYSSMVGFRNRVVHGYQEVSPERVYEVATRELDDFNVFVRVIKALLRL